MRGSRRGGWVCEWWWGGGWGGGLVALCAGRSLLLPLLLLLLICLSGAVAAAIAGCRVCIISYDLVRRLNSRLLEPFKAVIGDESHNLKVLALPDS